MGTNSYGFHRISSTLLIFSPYTLLPCLSYSLGALSLSDLTLAMFLPK